MSVFNNQYSDHVMQSPSLTGENDIRVNSIDFDTSCDCQVTACDGGTIKFCAKVEFDPPLPPQPHSDGTCEAPIPEAVFTKIKFSGESECQIENCPSRGTNPIVACSEFNFTQGLLGSYAGTCDNPIETVVTDVLKFGGGGDCQIVSCEEATPINICSPVTISGDLGTCDIPVQTVVTDVLKLKGGIAVPNIVVCGPTDRIYAHSSAGVTVTTDDDVEINAAAGRINLYSGDRIVMWNNTFSPFGMLFYFGPLASEGFEMQHDPTSTITSLAPMSATAACDIGTCTLPIETVYAVNLGTSVCPIKNAHIDNLTLTDICIDGTIGCDRLAVQTGLTEGISFSDDPCASPTLPTRPVLYEEPNDVTLIASTNKTLRLTSGTGGTTVMQSTNDTTILSTAGDVKLETQVGDIDLTATSGNITIKSTGPTPVFGGPANILIEAPTIRFKNRYAANPLLTPFRSPPINSQGVPGDVGGEWSADKGHWYFCYNSFGTGPPGSDIWNRTSVTTFLSW